MQLPSTFCPGAEKNIKSGDNTQEKESGVRTKKLSIHSRKKNLIYSMIQIKQAILDPFDPESSV
jgi:hypothetical protein